MRVLITGAASPLGQAIAARLRTDYQVRLTDREEISTDLEFVRSDLGHDEATDALVQGVDAIVHLAYAPRPNDGENDWLDINSRRHYNMLLAASEAGVPSALIISTLQICSSPTTLAWRWESTGSRSPTPARTSSARIWLSSPRASLPIATRSTSPCCALDTWLCQRRLPDKRDPMWLDQRDAAHAVDLLLRSRRHSIRGELGPITSCTCSRYRSSSFSSERICKALEFQPQYSFEDCV